MQFLTRTSSLLELIIFHRNKKIANTYNIKFLGLTLDNTFSWKVYIDSVVPRWSSACFAMRMVKPLLSQEALKIVYCSYFYSIMSYGIIFWVNSGHSNLIFRLQKKAIRIMMGLRGRESCRKYFKKLNIFTLKLQYIFSLSLCLWLTIGIVLKWTLRCTMWIPGPDIICIIHCLSCLFFRKEYIMLGLRCLMAYLSQ
jgi:hypothetical protein